MRKTYKVCTVSSYIPAVKSFYTYLEGKKITPNIAAGIKGAKYQKGFKKDALTAGQAKEIIVAYPLIVCDIQPYPLLSRRGKRTRGASY
jgi:hypothetical protein